jgi:hypothetical protein
MRKFQTILWVVFFCGLLAVASAAQETQPMDAQADEFQRTPPRLSLLDGQVSFWRPGAEDWVQAQINTALAPGDQLYIGPEGRMELQISAGAFVRGAADTQIGLENHEAGFIQFKVTMGRAALDLRKLAPGLTVAVDTPNAAFTIHDEGYYRLQVDDAHTTFITHAGARASALLANGETVPIAPNEAVTVAGTDRPTVSARAAPPPDSWDTWNHARTDRHLNAESARYVAPATYGLADLDEHGTWRTVPTYGTVWAPHSVPAGWVPYSNGTWMRDPYYGWTWVDIAPWGWAPYHYGRWVYVGSYWAWAPGPIVARPVYAPALVAFYGQPGVRVSVSVGAPFVGWVALGWGEPLVPWWGWPGFIHRPWWGGWGGPYVINNVIVSRATVVSVRNISTYRNARVRDAVVVVDRSHFGRGPITRASGTQTDIRRLRPIHTAPHVSTRPSHFVPTTTRGVRPPEDRLNRSVISARPRPSSSPGTAAVRGQSAGVRQTTRPGELREAPPRLQAPSSLRQAQPAPRVGAPDRVTTTPPRPPRTVERESPRRTETGRVQTPPAIRQAPPGDQRLSPAGGWRSPSPPSGERPALQRSEGLRGPARDTAPPPAMIQQTPAPRGRQPASAADPSRVAPSRAPSGRSAQPQGFTGAGSGPRSGGGAYQRGNSGSPGRSR